MGISSSYMTTMANTGKRRAEFEPSTSMFRRSESVWVLERGGKIPRSAPVTFKIEKYQFSVCRLTNLGHLWQVKSYGLGRRVEMW